MLHRALVVFVAAMLFAVISRGNGFVVEPSHVYLSADAGQRLTTELHVIAARAEATANVALIAFSIDESGNPCAAQPSARSLTAWTRIAPSAVHLMSGVATPVTIDIDVPAAATGSYWGAATVDVVIDRGNGMAIRTRVAVPIVVTVRNSPPPSFVLEDVRRDDDQTLTGILHSTGNTAAFGVTVSAGANGGLEMELFGGAQASLVLPGARRKFRIAFADAVHDGRMTINARDVDGHFSPKMCQVPPSLADASGAAR